MDKWGVFGSELGREECISEITVWQTIKEHGERCG